MSRRIPSPLHHSSPSLGTSGGCPATQPRLTFGQSLNRRGNRVVFLLRTSGAEEGPSRLCGGSPRNKNVVQVWGAVAQVWAHGVRLWEIISNCGKLW